MAGRRKEKNKCSIVFCSSFNMLNHIFKYCSHYKTPCITEPSSPQRFLWNTKLLVLTLPLVKLSFSRSFQRSRLWTEWNFIDCTVSVGEACMDWVKHAAVCTYRSERRRRRSGGSDDSLDRRGSREDRTRCTGCNTKATLTYL